MRNQHEVADVERIRLRRFVRFHAAGALAAVCAVLLFVLAPSTGAQSDARCLGGARCGSVTVPLDRQKQSAGTIVIHYALVPHTDTARAAAGTIVPNPGGPGQATIASAAALYKQAMAPVLRDRDLLLIDPRGTGRSGALACS
jgi:pimeloyl-ACP methyl ester carboxylesterase